MSEAVQSRDASVMSNILGARLSLLRNSPLLQGGTVWEKAGVNVSVVYGSMPPEAYRAATGTNAAPAGNVSWMFVGSRYAHSDAMAACRQRHNGRVWEPMLLPPATMRLGCRPSSVLSG